MAESIISAAVEVTLSKAISLVQNQINLQWGFKDELNKFRDSLTMTRAFLRDAETRRVDVEPVQVWMEQLRKIAFEADDVLDELAYEEIRRKGETQMRRKVCNFFSISKNPFVFRFKMPQTVKGINESLDEINDRALKFGLQQRVQALPQSICGSQATHSFGDSSQVVGRETDVSKIIDLLIDSSTRQTFSIISIVGMGGLGKTTLAKSVCNNERTKDHFKKIMWVCVSENFDVQRILEEMFESLTGKTCDKKNRNTILEEIKKELEGKTYLLALDDVWDENFNNWEDLRGSLVGINENKRSSILVTSRSEEVAMVKETPHENRYRIGRLMDDECWAIIKNRAFQNSSILPELEDIVSDIAHKCAGVPLVATVIGGTMCNKFAINEWVSLRDSSHWGSLGTKEGILSVLRLSFDRLPSSSLKQCFAYFSIFPKDFRIQKERLIQLWMAEGFLQDAEDIGNEYFNYLLSNSLLQDVEIDDLQGCITSCKMHDFVHDLAQSITNSETCNTRQHIEFDGVKLWHSWFSKSSFFHIKADFKSLRVLNFSDANISSLSDSIGRLKHLRYLDISGTGISRLPKSITQLYHLQTLRFLRCYYLERLPKGMKNLVSLRHLCFSRPTHVTDEIGCLTSLRTLSIFVVDTKRSCGIGELECLSKLEGYLEICNLDEVRNKEEAQGAKIWEKKLHTLKCSWKSGRAGYNNDEEVLEGLKPHSDLKSLTIQNYNGEKFPSCLVKKSDTGPCASFQSVKLVQLNIFDCVNSKNLPTIGQFPNLKFLKIVGLKNVRSIGNEFYINNNISCAPITLFPALEKFYLQGMHELKEWLEVEPTISAFPSLKELQIRRCHNLSGVPVMSRFSSLERLCISDCGELSLIGDGLFPSSLKSLEIDGCRKLTSIPSVEGGISFLQRLQLVWCDELSKIEEGLLSSTCLRQVYINDCPNMASFPLNPSIDGLSSLSNLSLYDRQGLTSLPSGLPTCTSFEKLEIRNCKNLKSIPEKTLGRLTRLKRLGLGPFSEELEEFPGLTSIHRLHSSLEDLTLFGWEKLSSLPDQLQHLTALKTLRIQNFSGLNSLPEWLGNLSSLRSLSILKCENLRQLPSKEAMQRLSNLQELYIHNCPQLKRNSAERSKLSHIPEMYIRWR